MSNMLRNLPSVGELLESPPLKSLVNGINRTAVVSRVRRFLDDMRAQLQSAALNTHLPAPTELAQRIADWIAQDAPLSLVPVINATGIILHPELGRAPLAAEAVELAALVGRGYCNLELNLSSGERCNRIAAVEALLTRLTGAEAATVVNNNAGAILVTLAALAQGREVVISRGQFAEMDGSYRLSQIAAASGAILREVGTANKTRISDYAAATGAQSAALMRVHNSNCSMIGDTEATPLAELVTLAKKQELIVIDDIGSGALIDLAAYGVKGIPVARESVLAGADLVLFSGDQFVGGPQCGIIVGRTPLVQKIVEHPLARALRVDKLTLAILAATLRLYRDLERAEQSVPLLSLLSTPLENLRQRAERLAPQFAAARVAPVEIVECQTDIGGSSLPNHALPTVCLALSPHSLSVAELATALRGGSPAVLGRADGNKLLLDLRSVQPREDLLLVAAVEAVRPEADAPAPQPPVASAF